MKAAIKRFIAGLLVIAVIMSNCPAGLLEANAAGKSSNVILKKYSSYVGEKVSICESGVSVKGLGFKSSNTKIVTVNGKGKIKSKKAGKAVITVFNKKTKKKVGKCKITVYTKTKAMELGCNSSYSLNVGETKQLSARVTSPKKKYQPISWESTNTAVATVTAQGVVTAVSAGDAVIKAKSGGKFVSVSIKVQKKVEEKKGLAINKDEFGYSKEKKAYTVLQEVKAIKGTLSDAEKYSEIELTIYDEKDNVIGSQKAKALKAWSFGNIGLFPGKNRIVVEAKGANSLKEEILLYDLFGANYSNLPGADVDTDQDGLDDLLEDYIGTDKLKVDTDNDGLSDGVEVNEIGTDPLQMDTDGNGINDGDEDEDADELTNSYEIMVGTSPILADTDGDQLTDKEELETYQTNPNEKDTDGDKAEDGWEVENGFDPTTKNVSFEISADTGEVSEVLPVVASVSLVTSGDAVESLTIKPVNPYENPFISPAVAGYMGDAYDFSLDGDFESAELTFTYNTDLGVLGSDFQPRIYYFNETDYTFEELPNQTVTNGKVIATTTHFSTYVLLNKSKVEEVWEYDILPPATGNQTGTTDGLDIAFVIDNSGSMDTNDPYAIRKDVTKEFINGFRENKDAGAIIYFNTSAGLTQSFTKNKSLLLDGVDGIPSNGGGTNGSDGIYKALSELEKGTARNKCIIFLTDGDDTSVSYPYATLEKNAKEKGIRIYTVGLGSPNETLLKDIAAETGGKYYYASSDFDLDDVYDDVETEIKDETTDSNHDGISDYYTDLIYKGKLLLSNGSNELAGIDLNSKDAVYPDDYDGDGLKNNQEIKIVERGNRVYIEMYSNPYLVYSDGDEFNDYTEYKNGSDPLSYSVSKPATDLLLTDDYYYYSGYAEDYKNGWLEKGLNGTLSVIYFVKKDELYRDLLIDYYCNYAVGETIKRVETEETKKTLVDTLKTIGSFVWDKAYTIDANGYCTATNVNKAINFANGVRNVDTMDANMVNLITNMLVEYNKTSEAATQLRFEVNNLKYAQKLWNKESVRKMVSGGNDLFGKVSNGIRYFSYGVDTVGTIVNLAKVNANNAIFEENAEILEYLSYYSSDKHMRNAAEDVLETMAGSYIEGIKAVLTDLFVAGLDVLLRDVLAKNPYVAAVMAVRDIVDILTGISTDVKQQYEMLCYAEMSLAYAYFVDLVTVSSKNQNYYEVQKNKEAKYYKYVTNLAQIRVLGELKFYDWEDCEGWLGWIGDKIIGLEEFKKTMNTHLTYVKSYADALGLTLAPNIKYTVG